MKRISIAIVAGIVFLAAARLNAEIYNAADDFNFSNPNGVWSYGFRATGAGPDFTELNLAGNYPFRSGYQADDTWFQGQYESTTAPPHVFKNVSNEVGKLKTVPVINPGELVLHPGTGASSHIVVRWTAPEAGEVDVSTLFTRIDEENLQSQGFVTHNGAVLFEDTLSGLGDWSAFDPTTSLSVAANDVIDFVVGPAGMNFSNDSTRLDATLTFTAVPEPSTLVAMCSSLLTVALIVTARRRKRMGDVN